MADAAARLIGPIAVPGTATDMYTVPALTTAILRNIHVTNHTGTPATLTMSIGNDASGTRLFAGQEIGGNEVLVWSGFIVLAAAEKIQAFSNTASSLTLTVSGVLVT